MTATLTLIGFAVLLAVLGPALLRRRGWLERSPRIGITAWLALSASVLSALFLAGLTLALPAIPWSTDLEALIRGCVIVLREQYSTPGSAILSGSGIAVSLTVLVRVTYFLFTGQASAARVRRRQLDALSLVARPHEQYGALVVEHGNAAAYCLPGRHHQVVVTTAALAALDRRQLVAVLAHERAHLRGRHHLILAWADAMQHAFPWVPLFRETRQMLGRLVEMRADDNAARHSDRRTIAAALARLAEHGVTPAAALGAGSESTVSRVRRLASPARPLGAGGIAAAMAVSGMLLAVPLFLTVASNLDGCAMPPCSPERGYAAR